MDTLGYEWVTSPRRTCAVYDVLISFDACRRVEAKSPCLHLWNIYISALEAKGVCLHLPRESPHLLQHHYMLYFGHVHHSHIMDTNPRTDKSSETSDDNESPDRSPGETVPVTAAAPDDTTRPGSPQQPQTQVTAFPLFQRLPAELRVLIWEFACAPPGPRIHFLEPIADPYDEGCGPFWFKHGRWQENYSPGCERTPKIHWEISERTKDPCFEWSGWELLSVCIEARRVSLNQKTTSLTSRKEQPWAKSSDMVQIKDIICIRASFRDDPMSRLIPGFGQRGFCYYDEQPSPRRLALEVPIPAEFSDSLDRFSALIPQWLGHYSTEQKFMRFDRLETVYVLDQQIKPRAHSDHQESMPPEMYTEAFDGHHGSKFVAIDPEDGEAVKLWDIPKHCWNILGFLHSFFHLLFAEQSDDNQPITIDLLPKPKLRFLACATESLRTPQLDTESPSSGFAFT